MTKFLPSGCSLFTTGALMQVPSSTIAMLPRRLVIGVVSAIILSSPLLLRVMETTPPICGKAATMSRPSMATRRLSRMLVEISDSSGVPSATACL